MGRPDFLNSHIKTNQIKKQDVWLLGLNEADRRRAIAQGCQSLEEYKNRNKKHQQQPSE